MARKLIATGILLYMILFWKILSGSLIQRQHPLRLTKHFLKRLMKWKRKEIESSDDLMVASAILFMHYGVIQDVFYKPIKLEEKISSVEDISAANHRIQFEGFHDYTEETLKRLYDTGHPCAVRTVVREGEPERWLPVLYLDDDGGVVWNPYSEERFIAQFYQVHEICCFTI